VIRDKDILLMKRFKVGNEYYTLPGGRVEAGEKPDQCAVREVKEETTVVVKNPKLVFVEEAGDPFGTQHIFVCEYVSGEPVLPDESEEKFWTIPGKNTYEPVWYPYEKLMEINFVSPLLREALVHALAKGFPESPYHFSSIHADRIS